MMTITAISTNRGEIAVIVVLVLSAFNASVLPWLFGLEAEFLKEFASQVAEPLEYIYSVDIQDEIKIQDATVFIWDLAYSLFFIVSAKVYQTFETQKVYDTLLNNPRCTKSCMI